MSTRSIPFLLVLVSVFFWISTDAAQLVASYSVPTWSGGAVTPESSVTSVTLSISSADGALGEDNHRVFEGEIRAPNSLNQVKTYRVRVTYTDRTWTYIAFHKGWIPRNTFPFVTWRKFNRLTPMEEQSGVFNHTARSFTGNLSSAFLNDSFTSEDNPLVLLRRLLADDTNIEGEVGEDFGMKEGDFVGDELYNSIIRANSALSTKIDQSISNYDTFTRDRLVPVLSQSAAVINLMVGALNTSLQVSNQTVQTSEIVNQTLLYFNTTQTATLDNIESILDTVERSSNSINSTGFRLVQQLQTTSNQIAAGAMGSVEQTSLVTNLGAQVQSEFDDFALSQAAEQGDLDNTRRGTKSAIQVLSEWRLRPGMRRLGVQQYWALVDYLGAGGLTPFVSKLHPGQRPQGFVNEDAGDLLDRAAYLDVTVFWNSEVVDPSIDPDPDLLDPTVALDALTGNALASWNSLRASDEGVQFRYANQRRFSFFCDNDWLLKNRAILLTIQDLMDFMGPVGCVPNATADSGDVPCQCWGRVERSRCSLVDGVFLTQSDEPIPLLHEATDVCQSAFDLDVWYNPPTSDPDNDVSITQMQAVEIFTSPTLFNAEIHSVCSRVLGSAEEADDADSKYFLVYSSFTGVDAQFPGIVFRTLSDATRCAINHVEMEIENNQGNGLDLSIPYILYGFARVATANLFKTVYGDWELQFGGAGPQTGQGVEKQPFFMVGLTDRVPPSINSTVPPPFAQYVEVVTTVFLGNEWIPVYEYVLEDAPEQDIQVDVIDPDTDEIVTQRFSGDRSLWRSNPEPQSVLPLRFTHAGPDDCWFLNCPTPPRADTGTGTFAPVSAPHLFDTDAMDLSGIGQPEGRRGAMDYIWDPRPGTGTFNPFTNPRTGDYFSMDDWLLFYNRSEFDPRYVGKSPHSKTAFLIQEDRNATYQDPVTGDSVQVPLPGIRCHPTSVARNRGMGLLCRMFETHVPLPNGAVLPELDADIGVRRLAEKFWESTFQFVLRGSDFAVLPATRVDCPNPQQIHLVFPESNGTAQMAIDNEHSYAINVTVSSTNSSLMDTNCTERIVNQAIDPYSTGYFSLSYCPQQTIEVTATTPEGDVQVCWSQTLDMQETAEAVGRTFYRGDLDLTGNTTDSQFVQQDIIQHITQQSDTSILTLSLMQGLSADSNQAFLLYARDLLRIKAEHALANSSRTETLQAMADRTKLFLFANQNLQEAAQATLSAQFASLLNLTSSLDPQRQALNDNAQKLAALNDQYLAYVDNIRSLNGSGVFELDPDQVQAVEQAQQINDQLQAQTQVMIDIGNRTFSPDLAPNGRLLLADGLFETPYFTQVNNLASAYNGLVGVVVVGTELVADDALKMLKRLTPNPDCPIVPIQAGCDLMNLLSGLVTYIIMFVLVIVGVFVVIIVVQSTIQGAVSGSVAKAASGKAKRKRSITAEAKQREIESRPLIVHRYTHPKTNPNQNTNTKPGWGFRYLGKKNPV